jgi:hypothetical protein
MFTKVSNTEPRLASLVHSPYSLLITNMLIETQVERLRSYYQKNGVLPTYEEMRNLFRYKSKSTAYYKVGKEVGATVAPVGVAWEKTVRGNASINLWQKDGSHPSLAGSYLAACVFYATVFGESPVGLEYTGSLASSEASYLQEMAERVVLL